MDQVEKWVRDSRRRLLETGAPVGSNPAALLPAVAKVLEERARWETALNACLDSGRALLAEPDATEREGLRAEINDCRRAWLDFGTDLATAALDKTAVLLGDGEGRLASVEEALKDKESLTSEQEFLALQMKKLENLLADVQAVSRDTEPLTPVVRACSIELPEGDDRSVTVRQSLDRCIANADSLTRQIEDEMATLQNVLPLATAYDNKRDELTARLDELELDLNSLGPADSSMPEELRKQIEEAKLIQENIADEAVQLSELDGTADDLTRLLTSPEETQSIDADLSSLHAKHDSLQTAAAKKIDSLEAALANTTDCGDVTEALESHLNGILSLRQRLAGFDPPGARTDQLENQLAETEAILDALARRGEDIELIRLAAKQQLEQQKADADDKADAGDQQAGQDEAEIADLMDQLARLDDAYNKVKNNAESRAKVLSDVISAARDFWAEVKQLEVLVEEIQDEVDSLRLDSADPDVVEEKLDALSAQQKRLDAALEHFHNKVEPRGRLLLEKCGSPGLLEVEKVLDDLRDVLDESQEDINEKRMELEDSCALARRYNERVKKLEEWFPRVETKLENMQPTKLDARAIRLSLEELKVFKLEVFPHLVDVEGLNQEAAELLGHGGVIDEAFVLSTVQQLNNRWNQLINQFSEKERSLQESLVRVGELDIAVDEVLGILQEVESQLGEYDTVNGDSKFVETCLKNLQLLGSGVRNLEPTVRHINLALDDLEKKAMAETSNGQTIRSAQLASKTKEMNELLEEVKLAINEKLTTVQGLLREVKIFSQDVEECIRWLDYFRLSLRHAPPMGAKPVTAQRSLDKYMTRYKTLVDRESTVNRMLQNGESIIARCSADRAAALRSCLAVLKRKWRSTRERAEKRRVKMEKHLEFVRQFDKELLRESAWMSKAELQLKKFKNPSKITDTCKQQMDEHQNYLDSVEKEKESLDNLAFTGTYLKYFGSKEESVSIKATLSNLQLRYKKMFRRAVERGRVLEQAYREDKRFSSSWQEIADWLEQNRQEVSQFKDNPQKIKEHLDKMKHLIAQITSKYPQYYTTLRLGKNLKERCTKQDPERDILQKMLDDLRGKWNSIRNLVFKRKSELDERLLATGRVSDAITAVLEWLDKIEDIIRPDRPLMGDLDTLEILMEQHKGIHEELSSHDNLIQSLSRQQPKDVKGEENVTDQVKVLKDRWNTVSEMFAQREVKLKEAMERAEEFHRLVHKFRDWFPQAENELRFKPLPETENEILRLIERHERFQSDVNDLVPEIEALRNIGSQISQNCHPNAQRYVKYYLSLSESRWNNVFLRTQARSQKLNSALRSIRGNAAALEEMLAWVTKQNNLLMEKEKEPLPEVLAVVDEMLQEHRGFHEDLGNASREIDVLAASAPEVQLRLKRQRTSMPATQHSARNLLRSGSVAVPHGGGDGPSGHGGESAYAVRCAQLQTKYRNAWRLSVERKKKLQDAYEHLYELESFKKFNFDEWRSRYLSWIKERRLRLTDIFRRQDRDGSGTLTRDEFIDGIMKSKFPTTRTELKAVFDIFDRSGSGEIDYREFMDALRPDRKDAKGAAGGTKRPTLATTSGAKKLTKVKTDTEMIADEIERQVSHCQCSTQFKVEKVGDAKYRFGDARRLYLVRFLNSCVMVRVGGGWQTLQEFLKTHDPCRAKGRTNTELREQFSLPEGSSQSRAAFVSSRSRTGSTSSLSSIASGGGGGGGSGSARRSNAGTTSSSNLTRMSPSPLSPGLSRANSGSASSLDQQSNNNSAPSSAAPGGHRHQHSHQAASGRPPIPPPAGGHGHGHSGPSRRK